jgi:cell division protein FtsB
MSKERLTSIVKPMGDVHDFEPVVLKKEKPVIVTKKLSGDSLTSEKAIQYILNERQKMDIVYAQLRKENEALKDNMEKLQDHNRRTGQPVEVPFTSPKYERPEKINEDGVLNAEIEKLTRENNLLKEQAKRGRISPPSFQQEAAPLPGGGSGSGGRAMQNCASPPLPPSAAGPGMRSPNEFHCTPQLQRTHS